jgi:hypothetical protein
MNILDNLIRLAKPRTVMWTLVAICALVLAGNGLAYRAQRFCPTSSM